MRNRLPSVLVVVALIAAIVGCAGPGEEKAATSTTTTAGSPPATPSTRLKATSPATTFMQDAELFFAAYRAGDRARALTVSTPQAVDKLNWSPETGNNPTLALTCEGQESCFIYYEGGGINL